MRNKIFFSLFPFVLFFTGTMDKTLFDIGKMKITTYITTLLVIFISIFMGCNSNSNQYAEILSKSLIVLPKAEEVQRTEIDGTTQIFYNLKEIYPASKSIDLIETQLKSMGWETLKYDELNFSAPTALVTGWSKTKDPKLGTEDEAHIWYSIWKNINGDYIKYHFQYFSPEGQITEQNSLRVAVVYVPSKVANEIKSKVKAVIEKQ